MLIGLCNYLNSEYYNETAYLASSVIFGYLDLQKFNIYLRNEVVIIDLYGIN